MKSVTIPHVAFAVADIGGVVRRGGWLKQPLSKPLAYAIGTVVTIVRSASGFSLILLLEARQSLRLAREILV